MGVRPRSPVHALKASRQLIIQPDLQDPQIEERQETHHRAVKWLFDVQSRTPGNISFARVFRRREYGLQHQLLLMVRPHRAQLTYQPMPKGGVAHLRGSSGAGGLTPPSALVDSLSRQRYEGASSCWRGCAAKGPYRAGMRWQGRRRRNEP